MGASKTTDNQEPSLDHLYQNVQKQNLGTRIFKIHLNSKQYAARVENLIEELRRLWNKHQKFKKTTRKQKTILSWCGRNSGQSGMGTQWSSRCSCGGWILLLSIPYIALQDFFFWPHHFSGLEISKSSPDARYACGGNGRAGEMGSFKTLPIWKFSGNLCITSWRRQWQPTPVLLPGKSHGRRSLVGCSPGGH